MRIQAFRGGTFTHWRSQEELIHAFDVLVDTHDLFHDTADLRDDRCGGRRKYKIEHQV